MFAFLPMNDLRFAFRQLLKNPGFTAVAVLTLALGIGACTAMFSLVHAVLLRPLPFRDADRLVWIENVGSGGLSARTTRVDSFLEWRAQNASFEELAAYFAFFDYSRYTLIGSGEPRLLRGVGISKNFLDVLGVRPLLGRGFTDAECVWNGRKAAILSHAFWRQNFASDPKVVGRSITLNGDSTEIVGVLPPSFDFDSVFAPGTVNVINGSINGSKRKRVSPGYSSIAAWHLLWRRPQQDTTMAFPWFEQRLQMGSVKTLKNALACLIAGTDPFMNRRSRCGDGQPIPVLA